VALFAGTGMSARAGGVEPPPPMEGRPAQGRRGETVRARGQALEETAVRGRGTDVWGCQVAHDGDEKRIAVQSRSPLRTDSRTDVATV
jgi:hypothetical protein